MELTLADSDFGDTKRLLIVVDFLKVLAGVEAVIEVPAPAAVIEVPAPAAVIEDDPKDNEWDFTKYEYQGYSGPAKKKRTRKAVVEPTNGWTQEELLPVEPVVDVPVEPVVDVPVEPVADVPLLPPPTFPTFLMRVTQLIAAGKADSGTAVAVVQSLGLPSVHALADNVGLIPAAMTALDELA